MTYRIALTGAQGTGKSTLARALVEGLAAAGVADVHGYLGLGTTVSEAGHRVGGQADAEAVRHFFQAHLTREAEAQGSVQVFDRCLLDALAYAQVLGCFGREEFDSLCEAVKESSAGLARLLWLRITSDYPVLTPQDESPELRRAIDSAIGHLARTHAIPLIEIAVTPESIEGIVQDVVAKYTGTHSPK